MYFFSKAFYTIISRRHLSAKRDQWRIYCRAQDPSRLPAALDFPRYTQHFPHFILWHNYAYTRDNNNSRTTMRLRQRKTYRKGIYTRGACPQNGRTTETTPMTAGDRFPALMTVYTRNDMHRTFCSKKK